MLQKRKRAAVFKLRRTQKQIETTIENFEPRIDNLEVNVDPRPDQHEFEVTVIFDIVGQEFPTQDFSFILKATR